MTRKLRVGIISANWGAIAHLPAWRTLDNVEVTAICTSRQETAEAAATQFQVERPFWSVEAMCADPDIDVIDVGTSPLQREGMVATALKHGKHVMNQVPFAASLEGARRLVQLQHAAGVRGGAATSMVGLPHVAMMQELIADGYVGDVLQVQASWQMGFFLEIFPGFSYTWFGQAGNGTSVTRNQGSHVLGLLRHLFGPITSVVGRMETQLRQWTLPDGGTMDVETDDTLQSMLAFQSGAMGTFATSWTAADNPGFALEVLGSKGRLRLDALRYPSVDSARLRGAKSVMAMEPHLADIAVPERFFTIDGKVVGNHEMDLYNGGQRVSLARLFSGFAHGIIDGTDYPVTFDRALEIHGIVEALYTSHERRAWVDIVPERVA
ncbi:Gfo/Idh/MocA family protein [Novosphingobium bradum]|uniref:Gfo/Idh/MocA family protein n=1 Tax=Novosphingobium bradum TaxID=1737444 RepID=A0ABV7IKG3_9SPHN